MTQDFEKTRPTFRPTALQSGSLIDEKYRIDSIIGSGGMGSVYRVQQIFLSKDFALKVLDVQSHSDKAAQRFHQEARTAAQLRHPNLVEVHDFGVFGGSLPYLVMELIEGLTLSQIMKKSGALSIDYVIELSMQVARALSYAHKKGVVHRDIKPGNIIILGADGTLSEGGVKVVDFGIAKIMETEDGEIQRLTQTGEVFGSPIYMSPEQCRGTSVDKRADIYSLGCVIYECLTGSPPFLGENSMATMMMRLSEEPRSLKEASSGQEFPQRLENIVRKMLALAPEDRYQDMDAVIGDLTKLQQSNTEISKDPKPLAQDESAGGLLKKRDVLIISVVAVLCCGLAVTLCAILFRNNDDDLSSISTHRSEHLPDSSDLRMKESEYPFMTKDGDNQILHFPRNVGTIAVNVIGKHREIADRAVGKFTIPAGYRALLKLKEHYAGSDPNTLKKLSSARIDEIDYDGNHSVNDTTIGALRDLKHLTIAVLGATDISSLAPLEDQPNIVRIEIGETRVNPDELLKLKCFPKLESVSLGPIGDPTKVFQAFAKSSRLKTLNYKGVRWDDKPSGPGLTPVNIEALSRIEKLTALTIQYCSGLNDVTVAKLKRLKHLQVLSLRNCGITAKSVAILQTFPSLKTLNITVTGWSNKEIKSLEAAKFNVVHWKEEHRNIKIDESKTPADTLLQFN